MQITGVLTGSVMMEAMNLIHGCDRQLVKNKFGQTNVLTSGNMVFIVRHGLDPAAYILPHLINHRANLLALKELGVTEVIGINSTGSLKKTLPPGTIMIPDDFISLAPVPGIHEGKAIHITPSLSEPMRRKLLAAARACDLDVVDGGIYWQVTGPRLETRAEIKMMGNFADVVGMTMASEAISAREMGLHYASVCSIDNYGNGLAQQPLSQEEIIAGTRNNARRMACLLERYTSRT